MSFGSRLRQSRENKGLSQQELANMIGTTDGSIHTYEKGIAFPRWDKIIRLCDILGVDPNYLFWDDLSDKIRAKIFRSQSDNSEYKELIDAYKDNPDMQPAINKMLDIYPTSTGGIADDIIKELKKDTQIPTNSK